MLHGNGSGPHACGGKHLLNHTDIDASWMRGWQLRRRRTAALALLAILIQLVVSFGHIHAQDLVTSQASAGSWMLASQSSSLSRQEHVPSGIPDDDCPICAALHIAATGLLPAPPSAAGPTQFVESLPPALIEAVNPGIARHSLFQTRAPPTA
jgi:hypothetical protein